MLNGETIETNTQTLVKAKLQKSLSIKTNNTAAHSDIHFLDYRFIIFSNAFNFSHLLLFCCFWFRDELKE